MITEKKCSARLKTVCCILTAFLLVFASFALFAQGCMRGSASSSLSWILNTIENEYYWGGVEEYDVLRCGLDNLTGNVLDKYSAYYSAEEYRALYASNAGSKSGIGVSFYYVNTADGVSGIYVDSVIGNSPAYRSGLRPGTLVTGASDGTLFDSTASFSSFISGKKEGEEFTLVTDRGNYTLSRQDYTASYCFMATNSDAWDCVYSGNELSVIANGSRTMSFLPDGAAYLSLSQFYGNAQDEMAQLIARFNAEGCTSLILDLRNNGGGYLDIMCGLSYLFTGESGKVAATARDKNGREAKYNISRFTDDSACLLPEGTEVSVLANRGTASASEALIGVLISYGVCDYSDIYISDFPEDYLQFIGAEDRVARTYGKGIMQSTFVNKLTGEALKLTTAGIFWPNGRTIHGVGLTAADGCKTVNATWDVTYADEELQNAVKMIFS